MHQWCVEYILLQTCDFWELQKSKFIQYPLIKRILVGVQMFRYTLWLAAPFPLITLCIWCPNYVSITLLHWLKNHIMAFYFFSPPLWSEDYLLVSVKAWADTKLIQILIMQHRCADLWWELRTSSFWVNFMETQQCQTQCLLWVFFACTRENISANVNERWICWICLSKALSEHPDRKLICEWIYASQICHTA